MSIGKLYISAQIYLLIFYIYTDRIMCYTYDILEKEPPFSTAPGKEIIRMAVSKAQQASVNKYVKANYDRINGRNFLGDG